MPARWRAWHPWVRLAPAAAVLAAALSASGWKIALAAIYVVLSLMVALWRPWRAHSIALPGYLADWGALLLCAAFTGTAGAVAAAVLFVYLMVSALLFRTALELTALGAVVLPSWLLVRPEALSPLGPAFAVGLALTVAGCRVRAGIAERLEEWAAREREAERQRLAADFHDGPLQTFSSLHIRLAVVRKLLERDPQAADQEMARVQELGKIQYEELRAFLESLRKGPGKRDFLASLLDLVRNFERESGLKVRVNGLAAVNCPGAEAAPEALKIVREALHNTFKHARAATVELDLARSDGAIQITVRDDGAGFPFAGSYSLEELEALQVGPESIKHRVRALGGQLSLTSRPGSGSELKIRLPE